MSSVKIKQPGAFVFINITFVMLAALFYIMRQLLSPVFYLFWLVLYLELIQATWISSEPETKIRYKFTYVTLGAALCLVILLAIAEYFVMRRPCFIISLAGFLMCISGLVLEHFGVKNLGTCFSEHVKLPSKLVTSGLYRHIRHPIYSGAMLIIIGLPLILNSYYALGASLLYIVILLIRVELEEKALCSELIGYRKYMKTTNKFFPSLRSRSERLK